MLYSELFCTSLLFRVKGLPINAVSIVCGLVDGVVSYLREDRLPFFLLLLNAKLSNTFTESHCEEIQAH